jgi:hypothetical protein
MRQCLGYLVGFVAVFIEQVPLPCVAFGSSTKTPSGKSAVNALADYTPLQAPMVPALIVHCVNEVRNIIGDQQLFLNSRLKMNFAKDVKINYRYLTHFIGILLWN